MNETAHQGQAGIERPSLYVVATPIGNLADITLRALDVLKRVAAIAAEDTRMASRLLKHHGVTARLLALHEHNERGAAQKLVDLLAQGKSVALISDAGTPAISDPGALAVAAVRGAGYPVIPVPGPNAAICATRCNIAALKAQLSSGVKRTNWVSINPPTRIWINSSSSSNVPAQNWPER